MKDKKYLRESEVAQMTGFALSTLRNHRFQGRGIPHLKISRSIRYDYEEVVRFMEAHTVRTDQN